MTGAPRSYNDGFERVSALKRPEPPSGSKAGGAEMTNLLLLGCVQITKDTNMVLEELKLCRPVQELLVFVRESRYRQLDINQQSLS